MNKPLRDNPSAPPRSDPPLREIAGLLARAYLRLLAVSRPGPEIAPVAGLENLRPALRIALMLLVHPSMNVTEDLTHEPT